MKIRPEQHGDEQAIFDLTTLAFEPMPFSDGTEAPIINRLREDGDLTLSLVAVDSRKIVGHVAFSPVTIADQHNGWFGLGPISVHPEFQRAGIGSRLVKEGLARLKRSGATGCVLIGDPGYYSRFGFRSDGELTYRDLPVRYVQWLSFGKETPMGTVKYANAFEQQQ